MNVLLICMSGITTNVLAKKLQNYSDEHGYVDTFIACRNGNHKEFLPQIDIILLAPQAKFCLPTIEQDILSFNIPVHMLSEEDLVFGKVTSIYKFLEQHRNTKRQETKELVSAAPLHLKQFFTILSNALLRCAPLLVFGLFSLLLAHIFDGQSFAILYQISIGILGFYILFSIGYSYAEYVHKKPLPHAFISLAAPLTLLPLHDVEAYASAMLRVSEGYIAIEAFLFPNCIFLCVLSFITILMVDRLQTFTIGKGQLHDTYLSSLVEMPLKYGIIFMIFILFRVILYALLYQ